MGLIDFSHRGFFGIKNLERIFLLEAEPPPVVIDYLLPKSRNRFSKILQLVPLKQEMDADLNMGCWVPDPGGPNKFDWKCPPGALPLGWKKPAGGSACLILFVFF